MTIRPLQAALASRCTPGEVRRQHQELLGHFIPETLDAIPVVLMVLNACRQVVLANAQAMRATGGELAKLLGMRPGEAFDCIHAFETPGGCGTTEFCSRCGALRAIMEGLEGVKNVRECNLLRRGDSGLEALDLQVSSSPVEIGQDRYTLVCIQDISDQNRRRMLERLFFHDMLNTIGGMAGLLDLLREEAPDGVRDDVQFLHVTAQHLMEEFQNHRDLLAAEDNELTASFTGLSSLAVVNQAARVATNLPQAGGKAVVVDPGTLDMTVVTDPKLLKRILVNMAKNALEASVPGETITLGCRPAPDGLELWVHNPAVMSEAVQLQVFKRTFSTKGPGRGLGTYGMRLLAERYLCGRVAFDSREGRGTTFSLFLFPEPPEQPRVCLGTPQPA